MTLFTLRYRKGNHGVLFSLIQIKDPTGDPVKDTRIAEEIGQAYCNAQVNAKYIKIEPAILADESIVGPDIIAKILNPPPRPGREASKGPERTSLEQASNAVARGDNNLDNLPDDDDDEEKGEDEDKELVAVGKTKDVATKAVKSPAKPQNRKGDKK